MQFQMSPPSSWISNWDAILNSLLGWGGVKTICFLSQTSNLLYDLVDKLIALMPKMRAWLKNFSQFSETEGESEC